MPGGSRLAFAVLETVVMAAGRLVEGSGCGTTAALSRRSWFRASAAAR